MDWVGDIPEHWEIHRLKHVASVQFSSVDKHTLEGEEPVRLCNYVDVYYNDFIAAGIEFMSASATESEIARFQLCRGDVLVTKDSESWDDIAAPSYVAEKLDGVLCGYHLAHIRPHPRKLLGEYLFRAFRSRGINDQFRVAANGITRFGLGKYWLDNGLFPVPPLDEQRAIAAFLDRETARIDALIEKKRRQIELLQEKHSALISHAVTKGLNSNAKMKDSGIEWLGEIPKHWSVVAFKRLGEFQAGAGFPDDEQGRTKGEIPFYKVSDTNLPGNEVWMKTHNNSVSRDTARRLRAFIFPQDTIVFAKVGAALLLNKRRVLTQPSCIDNNMMGFMPRTCDLNWGFYWLCGLDLGELANPGAVPSINEGQLREIPVPVPPDREQQAIAAFLDLETARIDALIEKVEKSIELLREYRTALISAAVTGKIDVRGELP